MGIKCIVSHGTLRRDGKEYRPGDEVTGLSEAVIKAFEANGLISVHHTTEAPVFEPPAVMVESFEEAPVTAADWKDSEPVVDKKRSYKKKKSTKSGGGKG